MERGLNPLKTVGFRADDETLERVKQLTAALGKELGVRVSRSQAVAVAVREALERRQAAAQNSD